MAISDYSVQESFDHASATAGQGTRGRFDVEALASGKGDFPHYTVLAANSQVKTAPWRGAYSFRVNLATSTTDTFVQETGSLDLTAGTDNANVSFMFYISTDLVMANNDEFAILEFRQTDDTTEAGVFINNTTASGLRVGIGNTSATQLAQIETGKWHHIEVEFDPAGGGAGTLDGWLNGVKFTQVGSLTNGAVGEVNLGVMDQDAGTTAGVVLFNQFIGTNSTAVIRIGPPDERFPQSLLMSDSGHAFVGPGRVDSATLIDVAGQTDSVVELYDTDVGLTDTSGAADGRESAAKLRIQNSVANEIVRSQDEPITFSRGCYVRLTGTALPAVRLNLGRVTGYSDGAIRTVAETHKRLPSDGA